LTVIPEIPMTQQIVIDIPASLSTLVPTLPAIPEWTARQVNDFVVESMFVWFAVFAVIIATCLIFAGVSGLQKAARLPTPPSYYRGPGFFQWLRESRKQAQR
jgi:hypothetical protein